MGVLAICALLVLKIFSGAKKKASGEAPAAEGQLGTVNMGLLPAGGAESGPAFRQHIAGALRENPDQVKQLFASWLTEEG